MGEATVPQTGEFARPCPDVPRLAGTSHASQAGFFRCPNLDVRLGDDSAGSQQDFSPGPRAPCLAVTQVFVPSSQTWTTRSSPLDPMHACRCRTLRRSVVPSTREFTCAWPRSEFPDLGAMRSALIFLALVLESSRAEPLWLALTVSCSVSPVSAGKLSISSVPSPPMGALVAKAALSFWLPPSGSRTD